MKNTDGNDCFSWCNIRHLNPINKDTQQIRKSDKEMITKLNQKGITLLFVRNIIVRFRQRIILILTCLDMKIINCVRFDYQDINLNAIWNYCCIKSEDKSQGD